MPSIDLSGQVIDYSVRSSKRAKRIFLNLSPGKGLELVYPAGLQALAPEALLRQKSDWILAAINRLNDKVQCLPTREYKDGEEFLLRGARLKLKLSTMPGRAIVKVEPAAGLLNGQPSAFSAPRRYTRRHRELLSRERQSLPAAPPA